MEIYKIVFHLLGAILPKRHNYIVFESFLGKQYSDNPRAISEYLSAYHPEYKIYWSVQKNVSFYKKKYNIKAIRRFSLKWMLLMNISKYWISNSRLPLWIPKPSDIIYIQTWHGTPLKKLALDIEEVHMAHTTTSEYKANFINESKKWDYLITSNNYSTNIFKKAFEYNGKILETGSPRNDYLIKNNRLEQIKLIKRKLNICTSKKIILYAPTWRDNQYHDVGKYKFELQLNLNLMKEKLGEDYVLLIRTHYLVGDNLDLDNLNGFIYDVSNYEDIRDLYLVADLLITDYSSVFFDYALLKRPIVFYIYDIEEYRDKLRGFYFDLELEAPGPLVKTTEEVIKAIKGIQYNNTQIIEDFHIKYCYLEDGEATKRVVEAIFK